VLRIVLNTPNTIYVPKATKVGCITEPLITGVPSQCRPAETSGVRTEASVTEGLELLRKLFGIGRHTVMINRIVRTLYKGKVEFTTLNVAYPALIIYCYSTLHCATLLFHCIVISPVALQRLQLLHSYYVIYTTFIRTINDIGLYRVVVTNALIKHLNVERM
jgi:hypothetical protein